MGFAQWKKWDGIFFWTFQPKKFAAVDFTAQVRMGETFASIKNNFAVYSRSSLLLFEWMCIVPC